MVYTVLQHRDYHNTSMALEGVPELLRKILEAPDFYVQMKWEFTSWDNWAELMEVNHDDKVVTTEHFDLSQEMERLTLDLMKPKSREVERRLTSPVINTSLDTKNIAFESRWLSKSVLQERRPQSSPADRNPLESLLGTVEHQFGAQGDLTTERATANNPTAITPDEYFNEEFDLKDRDIGRPKELTIRTQKFKATLWMCEDFPLSLVEQVIPIIDLMARTSAHFARLRDFIKLEFPPGFPVKIASPLTNFEVDQSVFEIPESYHVQDNGRNVHLQDEDYEIMQFAIQQSLLESSRSQELSGPASNGGIGQTYAYDAQYERAIQESLLTSSEGLCLDDSSETSRFDSDLQLAMELSARELEERELQLREEEAELQHVLQLSLTDNFLLNADDIKDELDYGRFTWLHAEH
ncbi:ankyrin repeat domain 13 isoform 3-like protein [Camelus ferus]|nr:ankyrin repeat domain 13 isoform 3-like protein [Camelus ferus]